MSESNILIKGKILEIQRMSTEDGPGIRTSVFMKGCGLSCTWCHNPESISFKPELQWLKPNCISCEICINACSHNGLSLIENGILINRDNCTACGECAEECPSAALEIMGQDTEVNELVEEVLKDRSYFEKSDGGVTVSGGEPALQADFTSEFLKELQQEGIHTAIDTCGFSSKESYEKILPYVDLVLFDIKEINPEKHTVFTGKSNKRIFENLLYISEYIKNHNKELWIRTPIIPDATATDENIMGIGNFIAENSIHNTKWELCAFNNLCNDKYERLGRKWDFEKFGLLEPATLEHFKSIAQESGVNPEIVISSGSLKTEKQYETDNSNETDNRNEPAPIDYCRITGLLD
ncbi:MAG: glycyl-radical enzyme activating protein [Bacteroidetes bacterium]|nr:MAG: glycyl-radical enzyme activating protein [Bacteroidota bacterium]